MTKIILKPNKDEAVRRFHPWVFSGAIAKHEEGTPQDGDVVEVYSHKKEYLGTGHYGMGSIAVRLYDFAANNQSAFPSLNDNFWVKKLQNAMSLRQTLNLNHAQNNSFRLIHGEGDGLPGLVIDMYNGVAVLQAHSLGMWREREQLTAALCEIFGDSLQAVYDKSKSTLPDASGVTETYLYQAPNFKTDFPYWAAIENNFQFGIDWVLGQKTGFFLDQRDNRALLARYTAGKRVLNAFSYSGGFSIYALASGASHVDSVDVSAKAIDLVNRNIELNNLDASKHGAHAQDVLAFLKNVTDPYDVMVLDPPAYAKSLSKRHNAVQGYKRLNVEGMKNVKKGGILFTFSCSQVVDRELFYNTVVAAAMEVRRPVRVLHQLTQAPDHPVSAFHPEGSYLKGLVLEIG